MRNVIFFMVIIPFLVSCGENGIFSNKPTFDRETFNLKRQLWLEQDIQNYSFHQAFNRPDGGSRVTVIVQNGKLSYYRSAMFPDATDGTKRGELFLPKEFFDYFVVSLNKPFMNSISEIFTYIEWYANTEGSRGIEVEYDSELHYPVYFSRPVPGKSYSYTMRISDFMFDPEIPEETTLIFDRDTFNINRQQWEQHGHKNYTFNFFYSDGLFMYTGGQETNNWTRKVTVKNGSLHEIKEFDNLLLAEYSPELDIAAQIWLAPIDEIFVRIEEKADSYTEGGLRIFAAYNEKEKHPVRIRLMHISPDSPEKNWAYQVSFSDLTFN